VKNTIIAEINKNIIYVGKNSNGSKHDFSMLKEEFPVGQSWFKEQDGYADLGFQGFKKAYPKANVEIPHKKPRKSENNPSPELTQEQKNENREISKIRVYVEHSIGGMKRYGILVQNFRNRKDSIVHNVIAIIAALCNFFIQSKIKRNQS